MPATHSAMSCVLFTYFVATLASSLLLRASGSGTRGLLFVMVCGSRCRGRLLRSAGCRCSGLQALRPRGPGALQAQ